MINAGTRLIGLFGHPVEHSFSPVFMNHALKLLKINAKYLAFDVEPGMLNGAVQAARTLKMVGFNITIPHKQAIIKYTDSTEENAEKIGAVNCVSNNGGKLKGYNTDYIGFIEPLEQRDINLAKKAVLIIGAGGAARAVAYAIVKKNPLKITIINRTREKGQDFVKWLQKESGDIPVFYGGKPEDICQNTIDENYLIINTTPVGMYPDINSSPLPPGISFSKNNVVYDLIYNPAQTTLLKKAHECGSISINGFEMLISQGLYSLKIWFPEKEESIKSKRQAILEYAEKQFYQISSQQ